MLAAFPEVQQREIDYGMPLARETLAAINQYKNGHYYQVSSNGAVHQVKSDSIIARIFGATTKEFAKLKEFDEDKHFRISQPNALFYQCQWDSFSAVVHRFDHLPGIAYPRDTSRRARGKMDLQIYLATADEMEKLMNGEGGSDVKFPGTTLTTSETPRIIHEALRKAFESTQRMGWRDNKPRLMPLDTGLFCVDYREEYHRRPFFWGLAYLVSRICEWFDKDARSSKLSIIFVDLTPTANEFLSDKAKLLLKDDTRGLNLLVAADGDMREHPNIGRAVQDAVRCYQDAGYYLVNMPPSTRTEGIEGVPNVTKPTHKTKQLVKT